MYSILALGESTTANLRNGQSSWPEELEIILNDGSKHTKFKVFNAGIPGTNTNVILSNLEYNLDKYKPNMVVTMMGLNDIGFNYSFDKPFLSLNDLKVYKLTKRIIEGLKYNFQGKEGIREETKEEYKAKEKRLIEAIEINPMNWDAWFELEEFYESRFEYDKLVSVAEQHALLLPNDWGTLYNLGLAYQRGHNYKEAEKMFKKVIEISPNNYGAHLQLGVVNNNLNKPEDAIRMLLKAIQLYGKFDKDLFIKLAESYREINKTNETYVILKKLVSYDPDLHREIFWLGEIYEDLNKTNEALGLFKAIIQKNGIWSNDDRITQQNYLTLYKLLHEKGVKLIVMQYPTLKVDEVKNYFSGDEDIIFVSNEENFNKALEKSPYNEYFVDSFKGKYAYGTRASQPSAKIFGHATKKGNQLIAENVAVEVLKLAEK
ncbi:tetratricopeptide repeat protein [Candidatus Woesearchaeota archaeon]|nr:tetratricopeptide repeat protein [Candidatus Woesearchaeota archaeon]